MLPGLVLDIDEASGIIMSLPSDQKLGNRGLSRSRIQTASCVAPEYLDVIPHYVDGRLNKFVLPARIAGMSYPRI